MVQTYGTMVYAVVRSFASFVAGTGKMSYLKLVIPVSTGLPYLPIVFGNLPQKTPQLTLRQS
jgi:membrane protein DedA with SNARE-associated domain